MLHKLSKWYARMKHDHMLCVGGMRVGVVSTFKGWASGIFYNQVHFDPTREKKEEVLSSTLSYFTRSYTLGNKKKRKEADNIFVYQCCIVMFWPSTRPQKMLFQGDAPEGSDTFQWPVIERDRVGGLRLIIWDKVKVPLCQYRLMHRKRVTSELHDSYFRLMTIKHSISKIQWAIVWALNYYLTQLSSSPRSSCQ